MGVDAELHVWDGMWHAFFIDPDLPESQQAYRVIVSFFAQHLGRGRLVPACSDSHTARVPKLKRTIGK